MVKQLAVRFNCNSLHLVEGEHEFEMFLPIAAEPIPFEMLREALRPQFDSKEKCDRFIDDMLHSLRQQQLSDAIAEMINMR